MKNYYYCTWCCKVLYMSESQAARSQFICECGGRIEKIIKIEPSTTKK